MDLNPELLFATILLNPFLLVLELSSILLFTEMNPAELTAFNAPTANVVEPVPRAIELSIVAAATPIAASTEAKPPTISCTPNA